MKVLKIVLINIILIALVLILFDWLFYITFYFKKIAPLQLDLIITPSPYFIQPLPFSDKKPPIVVMGCSFANGFGLPQEETLAYKLQKLTNRKVYNYAQDGQSVQFVTYKIQNSNFFKTIQPDPEYVIYVFIDDHLRRMQKDFLNYDDVIKYLRYKEIKDGNNKKTIYAPFPPPEKVEPIDYLKVTMLYKKLNDLFIYLQSDDRKFDLFKQHVLLANKYLKYRHPDSKFVVVVYNSNAYTKTSKTAMRKPFKTNRWKELEDEGIIVINFNTPEYKFLEMPEYNFYAPDVTAGAHPSGKAWDALVPIIIEKLGIQ